MKRSQLPKVAVAAVVLALSTAFGAAASVAATPDPSPITQGVSRTCTTDSSGYCTVTHTLGVVPSAVVLTPTITQGGTSYTLSVVAGSVTASSVRVRAMRNSTAHGNQQITFSMALFGVAAPPTSTTTATTTPPDTTTTSAPPPAGCELPAYPDATCTGVPAGTALTVVNGGMTITQPGTVVDGKDIRGCVSVNTTGVVIKHSKISCTGYYVVYGHDNASFTLEDTEIDCQGTAGTAVGDLNFTASRLNIHGCENGFDVDGNATIQDSYIHAMFQDSVAHTDGIQLTLVAHNITVRHNTIYSRTTDGSDGVDGTSAIISRPVSVGVATDILIDSNLLAGGSYALYCAQDGPGVRYRVLNNHFSTRWHPTSGFYGPWTDCGDEAEVSGNVYHENGQPLLP